MRRAGRTLSLSVLITCALAAFTGEQASADETSPPAVELVIPPPPARANPRLALEIHSGLFFPLDNTGLCPRTVERRMMQVRAAGCVLEAGGGVGATVERRSPSGYGVFIGYDAWFLDSDSVYELAVQQLLRAGVRYTSPTEYIFHPVVELSAGVMGLGDTFRIATTGFVGQTFAGAETELTESFGVRMGFGLRVFSHSDFRTQRDGIRRGDGRVFSEALFLEIGLTAM